jgi:hypothetical protein
VRRATGVALARLARRAAGQSGSTGHRSLPVIMRPLYQAPRPLDSSRVRVISPQGAANLARGKTQHAPSPGGDAADRLARRAWQPSMGAEVAHRSGLEPAIAPLNWAQVSLDAVMLLSWSATIHTSTSRLSTSR